MYRHVPIAALAALAAQNDTFQRRKRNCLLCTGKLFQQVDCMGVFWLMRIAHFQ